MNTEIGVIFAPFQIAFLSEQHKQLIEHVSRQHKHVVFALPESKVTPTKNNPLPFTERHNMLVEYLITQVCFQDTLYHICAVEHKKYQDEKVQALIDAVSEHVSVTEAATFYSDTPEMPSNFLSSYANWPEVWGFHSSTASLSEVEFEMRNTAVYLSNYDRNTLYRLGIIHALQKQFPISWPTVDMAIERQTSNGNFLLLGKKPGETGWRFPGGFKDRADNSFEVAVLREASEEVLRDGVNPETVFCTPEYICSTNVNDWRYAGEIDGITTMFFRVMYVGSDEDIKAGDDLVAAKWFPIKDLNPDIMEGEHKFLLQKYIQFLLKVLGI